jgi:exonuclease III/ribonuclease HI
VEHPSSSSSSSNLIVNSASHESLSLASININLQFLNSLSTIATFMQTMQIQITGFQEAGQAILDVYSKGKGIDSKTPFDLAKKGLKTITKHHPTNKRYNLVMVVQQSLANFVEKIDIQDDNIQGIKLLAPFNLLILNVYIQQQSQIRVKTMQTLTEFAKSHKKNLIIMGDLNSLHQPNLDYFSTKTKRSHTNLHINNLLSQTTQRDLFRTLNPTERKFSKWTILSNTVKQVETVTATRIDYICVSHNLVGKSQNCDIVYNSEVKGDHNPVIARLNLGSLPPKTKTHPHQLKLPHHKAWPKSIFEELEPTIEILLNNDMTTTDSIDHVSNSLTNSISKAMDRFKDSLKQTIEKREKAHHNSKEKALRRKLLKLRSCLYKHIATKSSFPQRLLHSTANFCRNLKLKLDHHLPPEQLLSSVEDLIKNLSATIDKNRKSHKRKKIKKHIDYLMSLPDFNHRIIYKMIQPEQIREKISYFVDRANPKKPKLVTEPTEVIAALHSFRTQQFNNVTQSKNIDNFLKHVPKLPDLTLPLMFEPHKISKTLLSRQDTAPGPDKIQYRLFKYLASHNSKVFHLLSNLYQACLNFSHIPQSWRESITISIPKPNSSQSFANWRPIALLNTIYKGMSLLINKYLQQTLTTHNIFPPEQCGFLPGRETGSALNTYLEILRISNLTKRPLAAIYIDLCAAFDSVQHWTLKKIYSHLNLPNQLTSLLESITSNCVTSFDTEHGLTDPIPLNTGVKQGDPLSPTLFLLYMLPLQWTLKNTSQNVSPLYPVNHLCFADDLLLLGTSVAHTQKVYKIAREFFSNTDLIISHSKSAYSTLNMNSNWIPLTNDSNNTPMKRISDRDNYKYLGINLNLKLNWAETINIAVKEYQMSVRTITSKFFLSTTSTIKLINSVAQAKLAYLLQFVQPSDHQLRELDSFTIQQLNKLIHNASIVPQHHWHWNRKLRSIVELAANRYITCKLNRGLNSPLEHTKQSILNNLATIPPTESNYNMPLLSQILPQNGLTLAAKTNTPYNDPFPQIQRLQSADIFTDAALSIDQCLASAAVYIPNVTEITFTPIGHPSSTNFEIQAIAKALQVTAETQEINIYTDSTGAINAISSFEELSVSQQLKLPHFPSLKQVIDLISTRSDKGFSTNIHHVNSHLLDKHKPQNYEKKLCNMIEKYKHRTSYILQGNQKADKLASKTLHPIAKLPANHPSLPTYFIVHQEQASTAVSLNIKAVHREKLAHLLNEKKYKVTQWYFQPQYDLARSQQELVHNFHNFLHRATHNTLNTKSRIHTYLQRYSPSGISPPKLQHLKELFADENCNLCQVRDSHEHYLSTCPLSLKIHDSLLSEINQLKELAAPVIPWFSTSAPNPLTSVAFTNFPKPMGDKGLLPSNLHKTLKFSKAADPAQTMTKIASISQRYLLAKWKLRTKLNHNPQLTLEQITQNKDLQKAMKINLN